MRGVLYIPDDICFRPARYLVHTALLLFVGFRRMHVRFHGGLYSPVGLSFFGSLQLSFVSIPGGGMTLCVVRYYCIAIKILAWKACTIGEKSWTWADCPSFTGMPDFNHCRASDTGIDVAEIEKDRSLSHILMQHSSSALIC